MCGLMGSISSSSLFEKDIVVTKALMTLNAYRGRDGTGMFVLNHNTDKWEPAEKPKSKKKVKLPAPATQKPSPLTYWKMKDDVTTVISGIFFEQNNYVWDDARPCLIAGHVRSATVGAVNDNNAHPFNFPSVIGMHNGTILGSFEGRDSFQTDSEAFYALVDRLGVVDALRSVAETATSMAYALVFYDKKEKTLNFIRNAQRPLHFLEGAGTLFWSSDSGPLHYVRDAYKMPGQITPLPVHTLVSIPVGSGLVGPSINSKKMTVISENEINPKKKAYTYFGSYDGSSSYSEWGKGAETVSYKPVAKIGEFAHIYGATHPDGLYTNFDSESGLYLTMTQVGRLKDLREKTKDEKGGASKDEAPFFSFTFSNPPLTCTYNAWKSHVEKGCACCAQVPIVKEAPNLIWINKEDFLCSKCADEFLTGEGPTFELIEGIFPNLPKQLKRQPDATETKH